MARTKLNFVSDGVHCDLCVLLDNASSSDARKICVECDERPSSVVRAATAATSQPMWRSSVLEMMARRPTREDGSREHVREGVIGSQCWATSAAC